MAKDMKQFLIALWTNTALILEGLFQSLEINTSSHRIWFILISAL